VQHISDLHPKFALTPHTMCRSTVNIQSATLKLGEKKRRRKKKTETAAAKYNGLPYGHNKL